MVLAKKDDSLAGEIGLLHASGEMEESAPGRFFP